MSNAMISAGTADIAITPVGANITIVISIKVANTPNVDTDAPDGPSASEAPSIPDSLNGSSTSNPLNDPAITEPEAQTTSITNMSAELANGPGRNAVLSEPSSTGSPGSGSGSGSGSEPPSEATHYRVYRVSYAIDHHTIYVESEPNSDPKHARGMRFGVEGNLHYGMVFRTFDRPNPRHSPSGESMRQIGWVKRLDFLSRVRDVCDRVPPPGKQFHGSKQIYKNIQNSTHWTEKAIQELRDSEVLEPLLLSDDGQDIVFAELAN